MEFLINSNCSMFNSTMLRCYILLLCSGQKYSIHVDLNMNSIAVLNIVPANGILGTLVK